MNGRGMPATFGRTSPPPRHSLELCDSTCIAIACRPNGAADRVTRRESRYVNRFNLATRRRDRRYSLPAGSHTAGRSALVAGQGCADRPAGSTASKRARRGHVWASSCRGRRRTAAAIGVLCGVLLTSCGSPSAGATGRTSQQARGYSYEELAAGRVDALPSGPQFIRINLFTQAPGSSFPSKTHQPGILYMLTGVQRYQPVAGTAIDIHAGEAHFQRTEAHVHSNIGAIDNRWYQFALWPSAARSQPLSVPTTVVFETENIASDDLVAPAIETLRLVTVQAGGHTALHSHGGLEALFVLSGTLRVTIEGQTPVTVGALRGTFEPRAAVVHENNVGSGTASYLAFFVTPVGEPFETQPGS